MPPRAALPWLAVALALWGATILVSAVSNPDPIPAGPVDIEGRVVAGPGRGRYGSWLLLDSGAGRVVVELDEFEPPRRGSTVRATGTADGSAGNAFGLDHRGVIRNVELEVIRPASLLDRAGDLVRNRVVERLEPYDRGRGLVAGFLIGDLDNVDGVDQEAMRLAGLSHFTAVSGSNVALFLGLLYLIAGPLALGPRRRAVVGLAGIPVYAAATGFEPSVMRASVMAGLVLMGKLVGLALEPWRVLALAIVALVIASPELGGNVGFQLSVAATAGVLVGARWPVRTRIGRALAVTTGAQLAVAPLLILHFGKVPLVSPIVNLLAAPLVTASTLAGAVGVLGLGWLIPPAAWLAERVLDLADAASGWPLVGGWALAGVVGVAAVTWRRPGWRGPVAVSSAVLLVIGGLGTRNLVAGDVVVLDVGQGDAILLWGGGGHVGLVDGGRDPVLLDQKLGEYGVSRLDLLIATHGDNDHIGGLAGLVRRLLVGEVWAQFEHHETDDSVRLISELATAGAHVTTPEVGLVRRLGSLRIVVLGPGRRYESANDESLVVMIEGSVRTMLLTGDIEAVAQGDLSGIHADVLKVPHHGSSTSDLDWLAEVGAKEAVISVGVNDFGHPTSEVLTALEDSGAIVRRTDLGGDQVVSLG